MAMIDENVKQTSDELRDLTQLELDAVGGGSGKWGVGGGGISSLPVDPDTPAA